MWIELMKNALKIIVKKFVVVSVLLLPILTLVDLVIDGMRMHHPLAGLWLSYLGVCLVWAIGSYIWQMDVENAV